MSSSAGRSTGRGVLAVVAGLFTVVALDLGIDAIMHAIGAFPSGKQPMNDRQCLLGVSYRLIDGIIGGYVAARLAPGKPLLHAAVLGGIGIVLSLVGAIVTWNMNLGPRWYSVALVAVALPCAAIGGAIRARQLASQTS